MATIKVKGGKIKKLASNAFVADGNTHNQGGIKLGNAEIEDKEVVTNNDDNSTSIFSDKLGYAKVAKQLVKEKGRLENDTIKLDNKINKIRKIKTTDKIINNTKERKTQVNSLAIGNNLKQIDQVDNTLNKLLELQEIEKNQKGLANPIGQYGFGDWIAKGISSTKSGIRNFGDWSKDQVESFSGKKANDLAKEELTYNKTLAEQQRTAQLSNIDNYKQAIDKIYSQYKPINVPMANYSGLNIQNISNSQNFADGGTIALPDNWNEYADERAKKGINEADAIAQYQKNVELNNKILANRDELARLPSNWMEYADERAKKGINEADARSQYFKNVETDKLAAEKRKTELANPFKSATAYNYNASLIDTSKLSTLDDNFNINEDISQIPNSEKYNPNLINQNDLSKMDVQKGNVNLATSYDTTVNTMSPTLAKANLNQVGYDVTAQQAAIRSNKSATQNMIMGNTSSSSTARALVMQNNQNATLSEAQVLENKINQENAQRAANTNILNATEQFNVNTQNTTGQFNISNQNQANLFNAQNKTNVGLANTQSQNQMEQFNIANQNQANLSYTDILNKSKLANIDTQNQASQYNISTQNQINQLNNQNRLASQEFNATANMNMAKYNADIKNTALATNVSNQNQASQYNANAANTMSQFNVGQNNQWNMNAYNAQIGQNSALLNSQIGTTTNIYSKYGGKYPRLSKYGYGGIIDQYYSNLFGSQNKYFDFKIQKYQTQADNFKRFLGNSFNTGISLALQFAKMPGAQDALSGINPAE
jgi:hypothetical protein